ncbi:hypothetical protein O1611_g3439 [Lasiodiplodia mahajangana]|uniref:Uncharacterized protein n=1 Tax=Lasiodiplodia mahajangana TaxID=1108764 RepID=A0ACC2JRT1_9PEZI|nr:hypothetical protein O1611_g3439 [Lasiodiplodia mahajangana]
MAQQRYNNAEVQAILSYTIIARTKRSRANSETEEEKSNAKHHNGKASEHQAKGEKTPKDQPPQDQSQRAQSAEQSNAEQKGEERNPDSKKRTREADTKSTDTPNAKRKASGSATKPSGHAASQGKSSYDHGHRTKLCTRVRACKTLADCGGILNKIPATNLIALAFALNDAKEGHRRELLGMLPKTLFSQIVNILANAYMDRSRSQQNPPPANGQDPPPSKGQQESPLVGGQGSPDEPVPSTEGGTQGGDQGGNWFPSSTGSSDSTKSGAAKSTPKDNDPDNEEYRPPIVFIPMPKTTEGDDTVGWTSLWGKLYLNRYGKKSHATYRVEKDCVDGYKKPDEENINSLLNRRGHLKQGKIATTADDEYDRSEDLDLIDPAIKPNKTKYPRTYV